MLVERVGVKPANRFPSTMSLLEIERKLAPWSLKRKVKCIAFKPLTELKAILTVVVGLTMVVFVGLTESVGYWLSCCATVG